MGKTRHLATKNVAFRKHPHGRGEDYRQFMQIVLPFETPPRAWGRRQRGVAYFKQAGNTPTGVGKTVFLCDKTG
ncbi:hypothetical protein BMETH_147_5 [methanotrophic bacterial endosymbiont of Bathymodiolus sp.]|nr:hypothetical protein BMETH_147_5 [methanotrophic bacterial endosymbiont of Bathymodiolus sp.]